MLTWCIIWLNQNQSRFDPKRHSSDSHQVRFQPTSERTSWTETMTNVGLDSPHLRIAKQEILTLQNPSKQEDKRLSKGRTTTPKVTTELKVAKVLSWCLALFSYRDHLVLHGFDTFHSWTNESGPPILHIPTWFSPSSQTSWTDLSHWLTSNGSKFGHRSADLFQSLFPKPQRSGVTS